MNRLTTKQCSLCLVNLDGLQLLTFTVYLFYLLFFCPLVFGADISVVSPTTGVWTESTDLKIEAKVTDPLPAYALIDFENSLAGWWRGEGNADDDSPHANHGTFKSDATTASGKFGQAFSFDGTWDSISLGSKPAFDFNRKNSFTVSAWVNKADNSETCIFHKSRYFRLFYHESGRWQFSLGRDQSSHVYSSDPNPQGKWVHLAATFDASSSELILYVDGVRKHSSTAEVGEFASTSSLQIGGGIFAEVCYSGLIDDAMIFSRALGENEISALHDVTAKTPEAVFGSLNEMQEYTYQIHAVNTDAEKTSLSGKVLIDVPDSKPQVTLVSPLNPTRSADSSPIFKVSAVDTNSDSSLASAALFIDQGSGLAKVEEVKISGESVTALFQVKNLSEGTYTWNCEITDSKGNSAFADQNHTLIIGSTSFYVSPSGSDSSPGTIDQPFQTIQKCAETALAGSTCFIRAGTYRETVTPAASGNAFAPIIFEAYNGEKVVISGNEILGGGWSWHEGSVYKTTLDWDLGAGKNQIFVDGQVMIWARYPNADDIMIPGLLDMDGGTLSGYTATLTDSDLTQPAGYWDGAYVHATWQPRYHAITGTVTSSAPGALQFDLHASPRGNINSYGIYYLMGTYRALDTEKEWFFDAATSTLYLWAPGSVDPTDSVVEAKKRDLAFDLSGRSYVNIKGVNLVAATIITDSSSHHVTIDGIKAEYLSHFSLIDQGNMGSGDKGIRDTGIVLDGEYNIIKNSEIFYSAGNGVSLIGNNSTVDNCIIHDVNYNVTECAAVHTGSRKTVNNRVAKSELYNVGRTILVHDNAENMKILHNEMHHNRRGSEAWDLGATYAIATDGKGTEIAYNRIHDIRSIGIYLDGGNWNFNVHHNVVWNITYTRVKNAIHMNNPSVNHKVYNNTTEGVISRNFSGSMAGTEIKNNICESVRGTWPEEAVIENNISYTSTDPLFVDQTNNDFRLQAGSPAIDSGLDLGFTRDISGVPIPIGSGPDIGAYEYTAYSPFIYGDVSDDGLISSTDADLAARAAVGEIDLTLEQTYKADVTGNLEVTAGDASWIEKKAADLSLTFPVEQ